MTKESICLITQTFRRWRSWIIPVDSSSMILKIIFSCLTHHSCLHYFGELQISVTFNFENSRKQVGEECNPIRITVGTKSLRTATYSVYSVRDAQFW